MSHYTFSFPSDLVSLEAATGIFGSLIDAFKFNDVEKNHLKLVVSELFTNAFLHGNKGDFTKRIDMEVTLDNEKVIVTTKDEGKGFDSNDLSRVSQKPPEKYGENGRGIAIIKALCDEVEVFRDSSDKCCVRVTKYIYGLKRPAEWSKSDIGNKEE